MENPNQHAERRQSPRTPISHGTYAHRLMESDVPVVRVQMADVSAEGVGFTSMIPLATGERVALALKPGQPGCECALCRVQHAGKAPSGHYRAGLQILLRRPGDLSQIRIPPEWRSA